MPRRSGRDSPQSMSSCRTRTSRGCSPETIEHAATLEAENDSAVELAKTDTARMHLPALTDGIDLGALYELAGVLAEQGVK